MSPEQYFNFDQAPKHRLREIERNKRISGVFSMSITVRWDATHASKFITFALQMMQIFDCSLPKFIPIRFCCFVSVNVQLFASSACPAPGRPTKIHTSRSISFLNPFSFQTSSAIAVY